MEETKKIAIGWFTFSCCEDNTILFTEIMNDHWQEWKRIFDFRHVKVLKSNNIMDAFDISFVEGAIASPKHEAQLKDIRARSKKVVAIGSCACVGLPSAQRNDFTEEQKENIDFLVTRFGGLPKVLKVADVVTVDAQVSGCPMTAEAFLKAVNGLVAEMRPDLVAKPA
jgi:coenzyme F420-reducing hydrogenase gamma subunit